MRVGGDVELKYTDVLIVGNGPSAITLSYILSGNWPYYQGSGAQHEELACRLTSISKKSLLHQDLPMLSEGLEGRSNNPISVLFDMLNHPNADLGMELPSLIDWKKHHDRNISHVVVGRGKPGGAWQNMDGNVYTISLGNWMDLPAYSYADWELDRGEVVNGADRVSVKNVAQYYSDYVERQGLYKNFATGEVVAIEEYCDCDDCEDSFSLDSLFGHDKLWRVSVLCNDEQIDYLTQKVVLATGSTDTPNRLNVPGESLPFVLHSLREFEELLDSGVVNADSDPLLIVGAGLSAADAVLAAQCYNVPVYHTFRRAVTDRAIVFNQLPKTMYPEYHRVHQMMAGTPCDGYTPFPEHCIREIRSDQHANIVGPMSCGRLRISYVVVMIGAKPNLSFMPNSGLDLGIKPCDPVDGRNNPVDVDAFSLQSNLARGIYAMGPLVGDNFVRFLQGGALAIAHNIMHEHAAGQWSSEC